MDVPTSSIFPEIYLQHLKHSKIIDTQLKHQIVGYFRYVDDILAIYNKFNNFCTNLKFTLEVEEEGGGRRRRRIRRRRGGGRKKEEKEEEEEEEKLACIA
jgi:hypothetical protein